MTVNLGIKAFKRSNSDSYSRQIFKDNAWHSHKQVEANKTSNTDNTIAKLNVDSFKKHKK